MVKVPNKKAQPDYEEERCLRRFFKGMKFSLAIVVIFAVVAYSATVGGMLFLRRFGAFEAAILLVISYVLVFSLWRENRSKPPRNAPKRK